MNHISADCNMLNKKKHYQVGNILEAPGLLPITIDSQWLLP